MQLYTYHPLQGHNQDEFPHPRFHSFNIICKYISGKDNHINFLHILRKLILKEARF